MALQSKRIYAVVATLLAIAFVVVALLWLYYPTVPRNVLGWVLLFVIGIPTWMLLEWLGERVFGAPFFSRLSRVARIALAVPILILLTIIAVFIIRLGQRAIAGA